MTNTLNTITNQVTRIITPVRLNVNNDTIIASRPIAEAVAALDEISRQEKALKLTKEALQDEIKAFMGGFDDGVQKLFNANGELIATWNWIKGAEGINKEDLKLHFNDVYEVVRTTGKATRRLEIK